MSHQEIHASLRVELPEDSQRAATTLATVATAWAEMLAKLEPDLVEATLTVNETKARPKGPRRPRILPPEGLAA